MKISNIYKELLNEEMSPNCDCCKYFDYSNIDDLYSGLRHPLYYMINKGLIHKIINIDPKEYLNRVSKGFNLSSKDTINHIDNDTVIKYAKAMESGDKFPIGFYTDGGSGQEGRHRALALIHLGCKEMPVVVIRNIDNSEVRSFVEKYKGLTREELDLVVKNMGYAGVSDLDWRDFSAYVNYRL